MATAEQTKTETGKDLERVMSYTPIGERDPIELSLSMAYRYFATPTKRGAKPTKEQVVEFLMLCKAQRLNPWVKDAFLVGYDGKDGPEFNIITAYQALSKRAELHDQYDGVEWGIIVETDGGVEHREGAFRLKDEKLVGAWAKVYRKDRRVAFNVSIPREPYDTGLSYWRKNPDWMLGKCARAAAMREAFPLELGGMYIEEEIPVERGAVSITSQVTDAPSVTMDDLTRQPDDEHAPTKVRGELDLELRRCTSIEQVEEVRGRYAKRCESIDDQDDLDLACNKRIKELKKDRDVPASQLFSDGELSDSAAAEV